MSEQGLKLGRIFGKKVTPEPHRGTWHERKATLEEGADPHAGEVRSTYIGTVYGRKLGGPEPSGSDDDTPRIY